MWQLRGEEAHYYRHIKNLDLAELVGKNSGNHIANSRSDFFGKKVTLK